MPPRFTRRSADVADCRCPPWPSCFHLFSDAECRDLNHLRLISLCRAREDAVAQDTAKRLRSRKLGAHVDARAKFFALIGNQLVPYLHATKWFHIAG
jgi:hypothetical protein